jgi:hypothetical protein
MSRRRNSISEQFSARLVPMLQSPAYRSLSLSGHRVVSRIEIELAAHGGNDNGALPVRYEDFVEYGITRECIAPAIREAEALGFIEVTKRGRAGNAEHREASKFRLTFAHDRNSRQRPPTHEWRKIQTLAEAQQISRLARMQRNPDSVMRGGKIKSQYGKSTPASVRKTHTENRKIPVGVSRTTGLVGKPALLSISRVGDRKGNGALPWSTPSIIEVTDPDEAAAIRAAMQRCSRVYGQQKQESAKQQQRNENAH